MSDTVRVYVNSKAIDVAANATALDAVEQLDPLLATALRAGEKSLTDSRGIATTLDAALHNGAIFRIVRARRAGDDDDPNQL